MLLWKRVYIIDVVFNILRGVRYQNANIILEIVVILQKREFVTQKNEPDKIGKMDFKVFYSNK